MFLILLKLVKQYRNILKIEISCRGEKKRFANPSCRGDHQGWFGAHLSVCLSHSVSFCLSHTHTQSDSFTSMLTSRLYGLTDGPLHASGGSKCIHPEGHPASGGDFAPTSSAAQHSFFHVNKNWRIPSPLHEHECCRKLPTTLTRATIKPLKSYLWKILQEL